VNKLLLVLFVPIFFLPSCDKGKFEGVGSHEREISIEPPDVGGVDKFLSCRAIPRREISAREECQIEKLSARCTVADDCLVSCITSPQGHKVGGGCEHVCFYGLHPEESKPPGWGECDALASETL